MAAQLAFVAEKVSISHVQDLKGAVIYYTLNGTDPRPPHDFDGFGPSPLKVSMSESQLFYPPLDQNKLKSLQILICSLVFLD